MLSAAAFHYFCHHHFRKKTKTILYILNVSFEEEKCLVNFFGQFFIFCK